jgi:hypothetical protein
MGYTHSLTAAGVYSRVEAAQIVADANRYSKHVNETAMPHALALVYDTKGWHPLAPGAYSDGHGGLHLVIEEMLAGNNYADTPENRRSLIDAMRAVAGRHKVHVVE